MNLRIPSDNNRTGEYNFSPEATANGGAGGLDWERSCSARSRRSRRYVNNPDIASANNAAERQKRWFFYGQDTWRATSKLTINYGLRWEIYFPETVNAKGNGGFANITDLNGTGAIRVAGFGRIGLTATSTIPTRAFAPRLGIAYQLTPKTVIRMGYGRSYDIGVFGSNFGHTVTQNLPVLLKQNVDATAFNPAASGSKVPVFLLDDGPVAADFPAVPDDGIIPFSALGGQVSGVHIRPTRQVLPLVDSWNATVQHQLTSTITVEAAFVGSKGTHGFAGDGPNYDVNPVSMNLYHVVDPLTGQFYAQNSTPLCRPILRLILATGSRSIWETSTATMPRARIRRSKQRSKSVSPTDCSSSLTTPSRMPTATTATTMRSVTPSPTDRLISIATTCSSSTPCTNCPSEKARSTWATRAGRLDYAIGGWQLANTTNWSSGLPWTPSLASAELKKTSTFAVPNKGTGTLHTGAGSLDPISHTITYFTPVANIVTNPGVFTDPGVGNLGNLGRNTYHGPAGFYSDLSVVKKFQVFERLSAQFRMDAFNIFNHPVYAFSQNNGANGCIDCQGGNNGKITALESGTTMRQLQFAIRFDF